MGGSLTERKYMNILIENLSDFKIQGINAVNSFEKK